MATDKAGGSGARSDLRVGRWLVQPTLNQIDDGRAVRHLEPQVMDLLVFLASARGRVVSKEEILDAVWNGRFVADATLTRSMADLRRALGDTRTERRHIATIPKRGYRLVASVSGVGSTEPAAVAPPVEASSSAAAPSLVVLPFSNLGSPDDGYFCEGLTDEIINVLTRIPGLRVISRTSAFAAHAAGGDVADIGRRLGVTHAIEGSSRRSDDRVRVTAQLIRASDHGHVWSERYDRVLSDVFVIQDEIAAGIARRLELTLGEFGRRRAAPTSSMDAYARFLEGRHHFRRGTRESLERAQRCFTDAIHLDPEFAIAHDALSEVFWYLGFYGLMVPKEAFTLATLESVRALEIDNQMAESHALLAMLRKELDYDWLEVEREFARARALDPRSPVVRMRYAICGLMPHERAADAAAELEHVADADPLSVVVLWWLTSMYWFSGQLAPMRALVKRMLDLDSSHPLAHMGLACLQFQEGELAAAADSFEKAAELGGRPPWLLGWFGLACGAAGRHEKARALRHELLSQAAGGYVPPTALALISLGLGDIEGMFHWFDLAIAVRDPHVIPLRSYPCLQPFRADPRYHTLLAKLNLGDGVSFGIRSAAGPLADVSVPGHVV